MFTISVMILLICIIALTASGITWFVGITRNKIYFEEQLRQTREKSELRLLQVQEEQKNTLKETREEQAKFRTTIEKEYAERRAELKREESRIQQKEEILDRRLDGLDKREHHLSLQQDVLERGRKEQEEVQKQQITELENIAYFTREEAKELLLEKVAQQTQAEMIQKARHIEKEAKELADVKAREIITLAIQRCASDQVADAVISVLPLPTEDMKGRIIGKEGRNIRAFEAATGINVIIDDTPDAILLSGFDPVRREIARVSMARLIEDGRIHPARIEEVVTRAKQEVDTIVFDAGEKAALDANIAGLQADLIRILGRLHFRTSYGQNVLNHSVEVSVLAATIAYELGADVQVCKIAGLLHDIGKAIDQEVEGPHHIISGEIARRFGKSAKIIHAIVSHHSTESEPQSLEAVVVQAADAISGARPGARRETVELYLKRLSTLEEIANAFPGVEQSFAFQAGRELRVIVKPEVVNELTARTMAHDIVTQIQENVGFPGQIKVCVIRETRSIEFAKQKNS